MSEFDIISRDDLIVKQLRTGCLAHFSYIIVSDGEAAVIDCLRDVQPYIDKVKEMKAEIKLVLQTHYHADFVSGFVELSNKTGATIVYGPDSHPKFENCKVAADNEVLELGKYKIRALHTPGHTLESSCFVLEDAKGPFCVFTGDTLFLGDVGRPDLAQKGDITDKDLAGYLFESLHKLKALPDDCLIGPGHGAGSACGKSISDGNTCTIGKQKQNNKAFYTEDKKEFVEFVTTGLARPPVYFPINVALNKAHDIKSTDQVLPRATTKLTAATVKKMLDEGNTVVIDARGPMEFDKAHIPGALFSFTKSSFAAWVANMVHFDERLILVCPPEEEPELALRLTRCGLDNIYGYLDGGMDAWIKAGFKTESLETLTYETFDEFKTKMKDGHLIDCRGLGEWNSGVIDIPNRHL